MSEELILQAVARGWCSPENSHKEMDPDLAAAIAREVHAATRAALDEAEARAVKAEAERDAANALLRDAVSKIQSLYDGIAPLGEGRFAEADETVQAARAHLGAKP